MGKVTYSCTMETAGLISSNISSSTGEINSLEGFSDFFTNYESSLNLFGTIVKGQYTTKVYTNNNLIINKTVTNPVVSGQLVSITGADGATLQVIEDVSGSCTMQFDTTGVTQIMVKTAISGKTSGPFVQFTSGNGTINTVCSSGNGHVDVTLVLTYTP